MSAQPRDLAAAAADPATSHQTLFEIARDYPQLRPLVAANPNTYEDLLVWLGQLGDPQVNAALAARAGFGPTTSSAVPGSAAVSGASAAGAAGAGLGGAATAGAAGAGAAYAAGVGATQAMPAQGYPQYAPQGGAGAAGAAGAGLGAAGATAGATAGTAAGATYAGAPAGSAFPSAAGAAGASGLAAAGASSSAGATSTKSSSGKRSNAFLAGLAIVAIALAASVGVWFVRGGSADSAPQAAAMASSTSEASTGSSKAPASPSPSASPTPSATPSLTAPAPASAIEMSALTAPSGNISCVLSENGVDCTINEHSFSAGGCTGPYTAHVDNQGRVTGSCAGGFAAQGATLDYGSYAKNDLFACYSSDTGMTCWSQETGGGFTISRASFSTAAAW